MKIMASSPITWWQIDGENVETVSGFIFLGSKITVDGDCIHKIKRYLLLGRIAMTNLDSVLKSRDNTLLTKVCLVKAMVFPVVMYGCDSWTIKKESTEELTLLNCDAGEDSWESLDCKEITPVIWKEIKPEYSLGGLMLKLKFLYFSPMWRTNSLEKTLMLGRLEAKGEACSKGWDG